VRPADAVFDARQHRSAVIRMSAETHPGSKRSNQGRCLGRPHGPTDARLRLPMLFPRGCITHSCARTICSSLLSVTMLLQNVDTSSRQGDRPTRLSSLHVSAHLGRGGPALVHSSSVRTPFNNARTTYPPRVDSTGRENGLGLGEGQRLRQTPGHSGGRDAERRHVPPDEGPDGGLLQPAPSRSAMPGCGLSGRLRRPG
jgi:hypothetical protein